MKQLIERAARDLADSKYAIALTGAGISTESGIADFRGPSGIWTKNPEAERRAYRSYERFLEDPKAWWEERLTSTSQLGNLEKATPNPGHYAMTELEKLGIVKCLITQNVDALHEKAGTRNLLEYHGSVLKLRCTSCASRFSRDEFDLEKLRQENQLPPHCPKCRGIIKSDGVAFGEPIPSNTANQSLEEAWKCDLMLICGTSAVVYPFASLPRIAKERRTVAIIEINAEPTPLTEEGISDYLIQGRTGEILPKIVEEVKKTRE
ncbi:NAD-dependent deacetylase [Chloroflexota bacterium]